MDVGFRLDGKGSDKRVLEREDQVEDKPHQGARQRDSACMNDQIRRREHIGEDQHDGTATEQEHPQFVWNFREAS